MIFDTIHKTYSVDLTSRFIQDAFRAGVEDEYRVYLTADGAFVVVRYDCTDEEFSREEHTELRPVFAFFRLVDSANELREFLHGVAYCARRCMRRSAD